MIPNLLLSGRDMDKLLTSHYNILHEDLGGKDLALSTCDNHGTGSNSEIEN